MMGVAPNGEGLSHTRLSFMPKHTNTNTNTNANTNTNTEFMIVSGGYIADTGLATQTPRQH